jgi:hypothetical protein
MSHIMPPTEGNASIPGPIQENRTHLKSSVENVGVPPADVRPSTSSGASPPPSPDMRREADRLKTFEKWPVAFMDPRSMSAAGFYYVNERDVRDVVRCAFCGVEVGCWEEGDDPFTDHQRWSPSCGFVSGLQVGNIPINSDGPLETSVSRSYDVCGPFVEYRPNSGSERGMLVCLHYVAICCTWNRTQL